MLGKDFVYVLLFCATHVGREEPYFCHLHETKIIYTDLLLLS